MVELIVKFEVLDARKAQEMVSAFREQYSITSADLRVDLLNTPAKPSTSNTQSKPETKPEPTPAAAQQPAPEPPKTSNPAPAPTTPPADNAPTGEEPVIGYGPKVFEKDGVTKKVCDLKPSELATGGWVGTDGKAGRDFLKDMLPVLENALKDERAKAHHDNYRKLIPWVKKALA